MMKPSTRFLEPSRAVFRALHVSIALVAATITPGALARADNSSRPTIDGRGLPGSIDPGSATVASPFRPMVALASSSSEPGAGAACDPARERACQELLQDNILWRIDDPDNPASKHWLQKNMQDLCGCTTDPYSTVNCFQIEVNNNRKLWQEAIAVCRARP